MSKLSIISISILMLVSTSLAFAQETKNAEVKTHEPSHRDSSSKFNGAIPAIGVGVVVVGLTATYLMSDSEEKEMELMLMLDRSAKWMERNTVPDERGLSFKLFEW